jgi:hypothetical protein
MVRTLRGHLLPVELQQRRAALYDAVRAIIAQDHAHVQSAVKRAEQLGIAARRRLGRHING